MAANLGLQRKKRRSRVNAMPIEALASSASYSSCV
jgi:hypothetical protein